MDYLTTQIKANTETRVNFKNYSSHRNKSTDLILSQKKSGNILIIGAGNCNDVDLKALTGAFKGVHLLDIDQQALEYGVNSQLGSAGNIYLHVADITQVANNINELTTKPFGSRGKRIIESLRSLPPLFESTLSDNFEIVVSQCLISQLVYPIYKLMVVEYNPSNIKTYKKLIEEIVVSHLKQMAACLVKNGVGIVISDTVSSENVPEIMQDNQDNLLQILKKVYYKPNYKEYGYNFMGTNIWKIYADHKTELASLIDLTSRRPLNAPCWKWDFSSTRKYIVQAFVFNKI